MNQNLKDKISLFVILVFVFFLNSYGLGVLEFIRHTEADRTLIAWEMVESRNFLVPHLIHSTILTKPPLYYWTLATAIKLAGGVSEYVVRMPSVLISVLFVLCQYLFCKRAGANSTHARFSAIVLFSSMSFFILSTAAEIDMLFSFLCSLSFYFSYFAIKEESTLDTFASYFFASAAFLTKGPPIVFFFLVIHFGFWLYLSYQNRCFKLKSFIFVNILGLLIFFAISGLWLSLLAGEVGWNEILRQFQIEVLQRIAEEKHHPRGYFYYFGSVFSGLLPWSVFLIIGISSWCKSLLRNDVILFPSDKMQAFFRFNLFAFIAAFVMLSIAKGKSDRYIFPVYACISNLVPFAFYEFKLKCIDSKLYQFGKYFFPLLAIGCLVSAIFLRVPGVDSSTIILLCAISFGLCQWFTFACIKSSSKYSLIGVLLLIFIVRLFYVEVYSISRNNLRSVKSIAADIDENIPQGEILYNVEVFERWINYYLKHLGRETYRLTPQEVLSPKCKNDRCFILLNEEEESWRLEQLKTLDPQLQIINKYQQGNDNFIFLSTKPQALAAIKPEEDFPTVPTRPF